jgi:hypothetical protein
MGVLANPNHERFCQEVHRRMLARESRGQARTSAYREHIYTGDKAISDEELAPNARRLAGQRHIRDRIQEIADFTAKLAGIDASWAMVEAKTLFEAIKGFNLDHYLGLPDEEGNRYYDLSEVPPEKLALLTEMTIESATEGNLMKGEPIRFIRKVKLRGPSKAPEMIAILALMARIQGWEAPKKAEVTGKDGVPLVPEYSDEDRARALAVFLARNNLPASAG